MKFKGTYIFALVAFALGGFAYYDYQKTVESESEKAKNEAILPNWQTDGVNELRFVKEDSEFHLKKESGQWKILAPIQDEAVNSNVESLIKSIIADKVTALGVNSEGNLAQYGLDTAKRFIELVDSQTQKVMVHVSQKKSYDGKNYLKLEGEKGVLLASGSWDSWLNKQPSDLRNKVVFKPFGEVEKLVVKGKETLEFEKDDKMWTLKNDKKFKLDEVKFTTLLSSIKSFSASAVVSETSEKSDLKKFKLLKPETHYILSVSGSDQPIEFFVSSPDKDSKEVYLYSSQKPFIYKSFESNVKKLMVSKDVLKVEDPKPKVEKEDPHTHTELLDHKSEG